jgi:hypothetical protein
MNFGGLWKQRAYRVMNLSTNFNLSICAPIDVNANKQLYCIIFFINLLDDASPAK